MAYKTHRLEIQYSGPEVVTSPSPAPAIVVECVCGGVTHIDRFALDRFTRDIWKRFDHKDLEPFEMGDPASTSPAVVADVALAAHAISMSRPRGSS